VFYMVHGRYYEFGGMHQNSLDGQRIGGEKSLNFNASLEFRPTDNFMARFNAGISQDDDDAAAITLQDRFFNNCHLEVRQQYYCGEVNQTIGSQQNLELAGSDFGVDRDTFRLTAHLEYDFGNFSIRSNTGYFNVDSTYGQDVDLTDDFTRFGGNFNRIIYLDREEISTELLLQSNAGDSRLSWMAGVYFYQNRTSLRADRISPPAFPGRTLDSGESQVDNTAIFGSLGYAFTDAVSASIELRSAKDEIANQPSPCPRVVDCAMPVVRAPIEETFDSFSPRLTLDWQVNDESLLYFSAAVGNKPGFINAAPNLPPEFLFAEEEESVNFEVGTKNVLNDGKMILNASIYTIDWDKQQLTGNTFTTGPQPSPISVVVNAGKTKVDGFEIELTNQFSDAFMAGFGYGLNDAQFKELDDPEKALFTPGNPSVKGNQTPNSSRTQLNLFGRYEWQMNSGLTAFLRADYAWNERRYAQIYNLAHTGDSELLNVRLGVQGDKWAVTLFVDNVTDDRTPSTVIRFVDLDNLNPIGTSARTSTINRAFQFPLANKRQAGITASYSF
jgi:iron complex outermembrane receptor protein